MRSLMRNLLFLVALVFATLLHPQDVFACSCMHIEDENERNTAAYQNADLVIQGSAISAAEKGQNIVYTISVEKVWKGQADAYIEVETANNSAACGIDIPLNGSTIIFIRSDEQSYYTGLCSGTVDATDASNIVQWLNTYDDTCMPYVCPNGDTHPSCTEEGHVINYFVNPCQFSEQEEKENPIFDDVLVSHTNAKAIAFVRNEGIVRGYEDGTYRPDQTINRAEFTKIITSSIFSTKEIDSCAKENIFSDVEQSIWYAKFVCSAKNAHIIDGYDDGTFRPSNTVNFAEAAKIVVNAFSVPINLKDQHGIWWKPYVFALSRIGGLPPSFTDPNQLLTRGEMAEIIFRVMTSL